MGRGAFKVGKKGDALLVPTGFYTWAVPGMRRAGPGERGGGSYGRRTVATAERAAMQISVVGKGLTAVTSLQSEEKIHRLLLCGRQKYRQGE